MTFEYEKAMNRKDAKNAMKNLLVAALSLLLDEARVFILPRFLVITKIILYRVP